MSETPLQAALPRAPRAPSRSFDPKEAKARAIAWAVAFARNPLNIVLDTETLGVEHASGICDIGIITIGGDVLIDQLVNPGRSIPSGATAIHGIADADVWESPTWETIYPEIADIVFSRTSDQITAFNASFDAGVINACCVAAQLPELAFEWPCAMKAHADFAGVVGKYGTPKWWRLEDAARSFGIEPGGHRALADARAARGVILAMAAAGNEEGTPGE